MKNGNIYRIAAIPGDGNGPEIVPAGVLCLEAVELPDVDNTLKSRQDQITDSIITNLQAASGEDVSNY